MTVKANAVGSFLCFLGFSKNRNIFDKKVIRNQRQAWRRGQFDQHFWSSENMLAALFG